MFTVKRVVYGIKPDKEDEERFKVYGTRTDDEGKLEFLFHSEPPYSKWYWVSADEYEAVPSENPLEELIEKYDLLWEEAYEEMVKLKELKRNSANEEERLLFEAQQEQEMVKQQYLNLFLMDLQKKANSLK